MAGSHGTDEEIALHQMTAWVPGEMKMMLGGPIGVVLEEHWFAAVVTSGGHC